MHQQMNYYNLYNLFKRKHTDLIILKRFNDFQEFLINDSPKKEIAEFFKKMKEMKPLLQSSCEFILLL